MKDKNTRKIYTDIGTLLISREMISNVPVLTVSLNGKIEFIIKEIISKKDSLSNAIAIIYYDNQKDLSEYLHTNNLDDIRNKVNKSEKSHCIESLTIPYDLEAVSVEDINEEEIYRLINFVKSNVEERAIMLRSEDYNTKKVVLKQELKQSKNIVVNTTVGDMTLEKNSDNFPSGIVVKLNGAPIVLIEQGKDINGEDKLIIKRYPNKNVINDDEYFNLESYDIDPDKLDPSLIKAMLEDIND